ncbi:MAG: 50S ribosomal protein L10, partial [Candidatus Portnoybacteria bacterium]
ISGLKVKDLSALRKRLKSSGADLKVIKKTLAEVIFKENKMEFNRKDLKTEMGFVFGFEDEVSPAKMVYLFQKENEKLKILGGFIEKDAKKEEEIVFLAQLPTRQELLAKLTGSLLSPVSGFINVLNGNIKGLVLVLNAISKNKQ